MGTDNLAGSEDISSANQVLQDLDKVEVASNLLSESRIVSLATNQVLYEQGQKIEYVYFPLNSVVSDLGIMEDGTTLETSMIGREGIVGMSTILGNGFSQQWSWVLISGEAAQIEPRTLERVILRNEAGLKRFLGCYRTLVTQVSQRGICNTKHTILERVCCWLLMIHDRVGGFNLRLTQELIASRVGARRAGITVAAGLLNDMRAIEYRRGQLHIVQRDVLEGQACECYSIMRIDANAVHSQR